MNINEIRTSNYLKKEELKTPVLVTIESCKGENVALEGDKPDYKLVITFAELEKPLICNITNAETIATITGDEETDNWAGHKIVLWNDPAVSFQGKRGGIRVRPNETVAPVVPQKPTPKNSTAESFESDHTISPQKDADDLMDYNTLPKPNMEEQTALKQICRGAFDDAKCTIANRLVIWRYIAEDRWPKTKEVESLISQLKSLNEIPF